MTQAGSRDDRHAQAWAELAWYANGSLAGDERRRVEEHLEGCDDCRRELEFLAGLSASVRDGEPLLLSPERAFSRVSSRIDAVEAAERGWLGWGDLVRIVRARVRGAETRGRSWRLALAGAALLAVIAAGLLLINPAEHEFRTLSSAARPADATAPAVRVVFDGAATADELQRLLNELGAEIVAGPSAYGVYTVRLGAAAGDDRSAAVIDELRLHSLVRFAEPIPPPAGPEVGR